MTNNNDIDMKDYGPIIFTIYGIILSIAFIYDMINITEEWFLYRTIIVFLMCLLSIMAIPDKYTTPPLKRLAEHDFNNNHRDNDLYNSCNEYKNKWDSLNEIRIENDERKARKQACKTAIDKRFNK